VAGAIPFPPICSCLPSPSCCHTSSCFRNHFAGAPTRRATYLHHSSPHFLSHRACLRHSRASPLPTPCLDTLLLLVYTAVFVPPLHMRYQQNIFRLHIERRLAQQRAAAPSALYGVCAAAATRSGAGAGAVYGVIRRYVSEGERTASPRLCHPARRYGDVARQPRHASASLNVIICWRTKAKQCR